MNLPTYVVRLMFKLSVVTLIKGDMADLLNTRQNYNSSAESVMHNYTNSAGGILSEIPVETSKINMSDSYTDYNESLKHNKYNSSIETLSNITLFKITNEERNSTNISQLSHSISKQTTIPVTLVKRNNSKVTPTENYVTSFFNLEDNVTSSYIQNSSDRFTNEPTSDFILRHTNGSFLQNFVGSNASERQKSTALPKLNTTLLSSKNLPDSKNVVTTYGSTSYLIQGNTSKKQTILTGDNPEHQMTTELHKMNITDMPSKNLSDAQNAVTNESTPYFILGPKNESLSGQYQERNVSEHQTTDPSTAKRDEFIRLTASTGAMNSTMVTKPKTTKLITSSVFTTETDNQASRGTKHSKLDTTTSESTFETEPYAHIEINVTKIHAVSENIDHHLSSISTERALKHVSVSTYDSLENTTLEPIISQGRLNVDDGDDTYWPVIMAVAVGVPTIIVIGVAIIVIHRRRLARPSRSRFVRSSRLA